MHVRLRVAVKVPRGGCHRTLFREENASHASSVDRPSSAASAPLVLVAEPAAAAELSCWTNCSIIRVVVGSGQWVGGRREVCKFVVSLSSELRPCHGAKRWRRRLHGMNTGNNLSPKLGLDRVEGACLAELLAEPLLQHGELHVETGRGSASQGSAV